MAFFLLIYVKGRLYARAMWLHNLTNICKPECRIEQRTEWMKKWTDEEING